jgi:uncharacterized cysteine cluster protein YcgN (CxxCxxCC family)
MSYRSGDCYQAALEFALEFGRGKLSSMQQAMDRAIMSGHYGPWEFIPPDVPAGERKPFTMPTAKDLQQRPCDGCTMCCHAPPIDTVYKGKRFTKPACVKCKHLTDSGCGVYDDRPELCASYLCLYALGLAEAKPMEAGVAWVVQPADPHDPSSGHTVTGHALNAQAVLRASDQRSLLEALNVVMNSKANYLILRDNAEAFAVVPTGVEGRFDVRRALIRKDDPLQLTVDENTESKFGTILAV